MEDVPKFHWVDYVVFVSALLLSSSIGVCYAWVDRKKRTMEEYLVAGRNMPIFPVSCSIFMTFLSAISYLGDPVESYNYGWIYFTICLGNALSMVVIGYFFAPLFHKAKVVSVYEFLGQRYNHKMQMFASALFLAKSIAWLSLVLYAPSLALNQVSGLPVWATILTLCIVSSFYTSLGGMKAVLWADTAQTVVLLTGTIAILVRGCMMVGGLDDVWRIANEDNRLNLNFSPSPLVRSTLLSYLLGGFYRSFIHYSCGQYMYITQRFSAVKTPRAASIAVYWNIPMFLVFIPLLGLMGQLMYAYFRNCDPVMAGRVQRADQMLPLMMIEILGPYPGLPGVFLAAVCCASLSSLSSGQSGMVACIVRDFIEPIFGQLTNDPDYRLPDKKATTLGKILVVCIGALLVGTASLALWVGGSIFQMNMKAVSVMNGPMAGIFLLAIFFPSVKALVAFIGAAISIPFCLWVTLGSSLNPPPSSKLPVSIDNCTSWTISNNTTSSFAMSPYIGTTEATFPGEAIGNAGGGGISEMYKWSPMLLGPLSTTCCVVIALFITAVSGMISKFKKKRKDTEVMKRQYELEALHADDGTYILTNANEKC